MTSSYIYYLLQLADNALIMGHRLSEWCGHGPVLEQDIALTNMALDHIGQARNFYQYTAELINELPEADQLGLFNSVSINNKISKGGAITEDDLAYLRDAWDFRNTLLAEQPNKDWAYTVIRSFFYDHFNALYFDELSRAKDERLAAIAAKSLKEVLYHKKWSSEWVIRLGDGTEESHKRIQEALEDRWPYSGELFTESEADRSALEKTEAAPLPALKTRWSEQISEVLSEATLPAPDMNAWMHTGGKTGTHSENLGYILAELQFLQRAYPGMEW